MIIFFVIVVVVMYVSPFFRGLVFHPLKSFFYSLKDICAYVKYRNWNVLLGGKLDCYVAHFGGGKTLSCVAEARRLYYRYNNKKVYSFERACFVIQKVVVLSNVEIKDIAYIPLTGLKQVVEFAKSQKKYDDDNNTRTVLIVFIDEASALLNSRSYRDNIDALFLNTLITSRHYNINFLYTSQKFKLTDALLRSVTQRVIHCHKMWRIVIQDVYNADDVEQIQDTRTLKPLYSFLRFANDSLFNSYDTYSSVGQLEKKVEENDMLSYAEILEMRQSLGSFDEVADKKKKRRFRKK